MLPKNKRVTKDLFQNVMKNGKMLSTPFFVLRYIQAKTPQYAFIAPKSVAKQAVLRNKLRRRGYSVLNKNTQIPNIIGLFFYKKDANKASFSEINETINNMLSRINL